MVTGSILISLIFLALGLLTGFFARRFINITVFVLLIYGGMITLEALGMTQSWSTFNELSQHLVRTGRTTIKLFTKLLNGAPVLGSGLFLVGGVVGLFTNRH